ncbi:MAG: Glutamate racemase [Candidatus Woesebacteria bacterium GW2011_GWA1_39_8]|jgi:glutamate racemase|uniref:Glutamate racemase n=1 Tax=Candidatus Woesebacteria bacterium GW2011_GWA1_39_8 TaxID=1618552 RepID=A0A0G0SQX5_9BACT|nr:MAG: Glutamate racemase [Candidatus Woesebacteria bacterium GW2011_GWA1_39_8]
MKNLPIGVFDSGLGGLTVVKELQRALTNEKIIYLGDTARVPYGTRSKNTIKKFALQDVNFLLKRRVKCVVIACNTVSSIAANEIKKFTNVPIFDVVTSGINAVNSLKGVKSIAVIATTATINSHSYKKKLLIHNKDVVIEQACPLFVPLIEEGITSGPILEHTIQKYFARIKEAKPDVLVLGCTHYPIIEKAIRKHLKDTLVLNPAIWLASELKVFLKNNNLLTGNKSNTTVYYVTDLSNSFSETAKMFLGKSIKKPVLATLSDED